MSLNNNYRNILSQIESSKQKSPYHQEVILVAVTKTIEPQMINKAIEMGIDNIAENRVQEIQRKYADVLNIPSLKWHQIGSLQTNKVKYIIDKVEMIHSLDRYELAKEIDRQAKKHNKTQRCLLQVKVSEEESKKGAQKEDVFRLIEDINKDFSSIVLCGLMGMAPYYEDAEESRKYFRELRKIFEEVKERKLVGEDFVHLSMGMSNDYPIAIEEGATMVRIGSSLFLE